MKESLSSNTTLSHYRIVSKLGAGGMGEVYLAEDTKLDRKVALKILPQEFAEDKDRMNRFVREAKSASALNHPNIITIHEIGESESAHFIATEFIDGKTLNEYAKSNPLNFKSALEIAIQIASALDEAHSAGIVHRDIKPDNVMVRENGLVKILDFGIAKLSGATNQSKLDAEAATAIKGTCPGMIIGTANYMSPEQAKGKEVDARSDIFSFGVVLYEMISARLPFEGETALEMIGAILHKEPKPLNSDVPPEIEKIISKCLSKDRNERYQTIKDLLIDLKDVKQDLEFQDKLERTTAPNREEAKTQILQATTTVDNQEVEQKTNPQSAIPNLQSIAVLPFTNMSADEENEYFCDGLAEELLNALAKIEDLKVAARTSAFSFKSKNTNVSEIGKTLNVNTVLEGSVRRSGNRVRITVQLVNAADGYHLWSERYDREMQDIFDVQDEITLAVVDALKVKLLGGEKAAVLKRYTDNTKAYQLYLMGRFQHGNYTEAGWRKGIEYFEQALTCEPDYAPAHAGIAEACGFLWYFGYDTRTEVIVRERAAIARALEIDAELPDVYRSRARLLFFVDWNFPAAVRDIAHAIALKPNDAQAHGLQGLFLIALGHTEEALTAARRARELDPLSLVSGIAAGWTLWFAEQYEEGITLANALLELYPHSDEAFRLQGCCQWTLEDYVAAEESIKNALAEASLPLTLTNLCAVYAYSGRQEEARQILGQLHKRRERDYVPALYLAYAYILIGEIEEAFVWLEKALAERNGELVFLGSNQKWLSLLRQDPRFTALLRRIGLLTEVTSLNPANETLEAQTVMLQLTTASGKQETEEKDLGGRNADVRLNSEQTTKPKSQIGNPKSKWWLFGLLSLIVLVGGLFGYKYLGLNNSKQIESIAVMPFVNESANQDAEYLSDGMTETLISSLSQLPNLSVKARSSVFRYKGKETDPLTIGKALNVQAILNGRVVQRGEQLTLSLELIDAQTENVIWSEQYNRRQADLVTLQSEIARDVSGKLKTKLSGADEAKVAKSYTTNTEAYQLYLKGRYSWNKRTGESLKQAVEFYRQAIEKDPSYALAYSGLAETYALFPQFSVAPPKDSAPLAKAAALRALALDDSLAEAHTALGAYLNYFERDRVGAEKEFRRAIELNPNYATAHNWLGIDLLAPTKRFAEAIAELKRAEELDPLSPMIGANLGVAILFARRYDEAIAQCKRVLSLDPNFAFARFNLGGAFHSKGLYAEAITEYRKALELSDDPFTKGFLALSLAKSGQRDEAMRLLNQLKLESAQRYVPSYAIAIVFIGLNEKDEAIKWLEKDVAERSFYASYYAVAPELEDLRSAPRFKEMLKRLNLPE